MHSWMFNTYSWVSIGRHEKDWKIWEENDCPEDLPSTHLDAALFTGLGKKFQTDLPNLRTLKIDNRPGHSHKIYQSRSLIAMNDDGSVVITDGYGSQIIMAGGNIYLTAQGDIWQQPGRSAITWAPHDIIQRAGNCVDVTAAKKDIRLKAERNLHGLAGNAGDFGGIMFEARGKGFATDYSKAGTDVISTGIALVAKDSQILEYGRRIYHRATNEGEIIMDADQGKGYIFQFSNGEFHTTQKGVTNLFGVRPSQGLNGAVASYFDDRNVLYSQAGAFVTSARIIAAPAASMIIKGTMLAKQFGQDNGSVFVGSKWHAKTSKDLNKVADDMVDLQLDAATSVREVSKQLYVDKTMIGNETYLKQLGFSCRTDDQYGLQNFVIFESNWQHLYTANGAGTTWDEPIVMGPNGSLTRPHPGHETWTGEKYGVNKFKFWDNGGTNNERDFDETDPEGNAPEMKRLDQNYVINIQE
jgi:hypothetical protein